MKIKIAIRHNLIYPILLSTFTLFRSIDAILMGQIIDFKSSLLLTIIMFFSELISGIILYIYQKYFNLDSKKSTSVEINSKRNSLNKDIYSNSNNIWIYMLLLALSFLDFIQFIIATYYLPNYTIKSNSLKARLGNMATIFSSFFYHFLLNFNLFKHQKISLLIIFFCLIAIIISESFFERIFENSSSKNLYYVLFLIIINYFFLSFMDISEKYLLEYHKINPYKMLMIQGIFGLIITSFYAIYENPLDVKYNYNKKRNQFLLLFIFLLLYFLLSAGKNTYRILTNKRYSPITKIIADNFLDPLLIVYYFLFKNDLHNFFFFIFNLILSIIMNFFGLVFNDFIILYCCNLEHETYYEISKRAYNIEKIMPLQNFEIRETIDDEYEISYERNKTQDF